MLLDKFTEYFSRLKENVQKQYNCYIFYTKINFFHPITYTFILLYAISSSLPIRSNLPWISIEIFLVHLQNFVNVTTKREKSSRLRFRKREKGESFWPAPRLED